MSWQNPGPAKLRDLLARTRSVGIVGASPKPERPAHWISAYLEEAGYDVIPVRPGGATIRGRAAVPTLRDLAAPVDLAVLFRASAFVAGHVDEALDAGIPAIWLQDGVVDLVAAQRARDAGLTVVVNDCIYRVHRRLLG